MPSVPESGGVQACRAVPGQTLMPARLNRMHSEQVRAKIQSSALITRLHQAAMGEIELTQTQISAINALLDRSVPKLSQIQHVGDSEQPVVHRFQWKN